MANEAGLKALLHGAISHNVIAINRIQRARHQLPVKTLWFIVPQQRQSANVHNNVNIIP